MPFRLLRLVSVVFILGGAALTLAGSLLPWANVRILRVDAGVPGVVFAAGAACLAVATLVFLGGRRWPLLCIAGAVVVLMQAQAARIAVPRRVHGQMVGAQMGLYPINRLLDQFHLPDLQVADFSTPPDALLGPGVFWTLWGGGILLAGGLLGLPIDPMARWIWERTARRRCSGCGRTWTRARDAFFCPACGTGLVPADCRPCIHCSRLPMPGDHFCAGCGQELSASRDSSASGF